jgi:predicted transcriptional regulator
MLTERDIKNIFILKKKGSTISEIARNLNLDRKTIRKYLRTENQPNAESVPPPLQRRYRSYATGGDHSNKEVTNGAVYTEVFDISQEALNRFDRGQKSVQSQRQKGIKESDQIPWIVEQSGVERHQKWIEDMQKWALSNCIPFDVDIPSSLKFQITDEVGKVLENRHERENMWEIRRLIEESVKGLVQSYLDEQEAERKAEEADRNRIRKAQLITSALGEVDRCVFINRLESYLNENARNRMQRSEGENKRDREAKRRNEGEATPGKGERAEGQIVD